MTGLFDTEPEEGKPETTPILAYLEKFFSVQGLRYGSLIVHALGEGENKFIGIIEVMGLPKAMCGITPGTMYADLGFRDWEGLIDHFVENGSMVTGLPKSNDVPPLLRRRMT